MSDGHDKIEVFFLLETVFNIISIHWSTNEDLIPGGGEQICLFSLLWIGIY